MQKLFAIGIPTYNRADLLNESLQKYVVDFPQTSIIIVDNGNQQLFQHPNIVVFKHSHNTGFTKSCAELLHHIYKIMDKRWAIIINDDVYWGKKEDEVTDFILNDAADDHLVTSYMNWCNFMMPVQTHDKVGEWDYKNFFNYFSDNDYARRLALLDMNFRPSRFMDPVIYRNSMTIAKDPSINATSFDESKKKYIKKWGGMPGSETFKIPQ